jgi:transposase
VSIALPVAPARFYTVAALMERYGVGGKIIVDWIRRGELHAVDVSKRRGSKKPRFRVSPAALERFEAARSTTSAVNMPRARRRAKDDGDGVIRFF